MNKSRTNQPVNTRVVCTLALIAALSIGCAQLQTLPKEPALGSGMTLLPGLKVVRNVDHGRLLLLPDHHIGSYDGFIIEPIQVAYRRQQTALSDDAAQALGHRLRERLAESVVAGGLDLGTEPHECLLGLRVEILDLEMRDVDQHSGKNRRVVDLAGGAVLVFNFRDSQSGKTLMRYGQRRRLPGGAVTTVGSLSASGLVHRIGEGLEDMGEAIARFTPTTTEFREGTSCVGKIGRERGYDAKGQPAEGAPARGEARGSSI
jgi:hypothetical protein